jgi:glycosyltransferase involved in cell wall biosynthesis
MKVAWIFPQNKMCGISFYSHAYVDALKPLVDVVSVDPDDLVGRKAETIGIINKCDIVHLQYETSFFMRDNKDLYLKACASIRRPIVVTLHEVHDQFPGVYPRDNITGSFPLRNLKLWLYDRRHPYITALTRHTRKKFLSSAILVHSRFQKDILASKGVPPEMVTVLPVPVNPTTAHPATFWSGIGPLNLASTGFINDSFDYDLLFETLALCNLPWRFTWIGGVRRPDDQTLFKHIQGEIERRNWGDRFSITGTIPMDKRDTLLSQTHIYCAFFKYKSSSESLATALGSRALICSTSLPLTREITERFPVMTLIGRDASEAQLAIRRMATDSPVQENLKIAMDGYCQEYGRQRMARRLVSLYEKKAVV